jgi:Flp pilus assembly protein TadB
MTVPAASEAWPAMLALAVALLIWSPGGVPAGRRARAMGRAADRGPRPPAGPEENGPAPAWRNRALAGAAGLAVGVLIGGAVGAGAALGVTVGVARLLRSRAAGDDQAVRASLLADLPGACDLLAVCLAAGMPVGGALAAVGAATPAPLGPALCGVAALYRLGAEPRRAWADVPGELAGLGRVLVRAGESGSSVVPALRFLAADCRASARAAAGAAVQRAGVWVLAPLGACFLPAFLCLGVVPLVLGIAGDVFG